MIEIEDALTVVLTTHVLPSAPSTEVIEATISSIKDNFTDIEVCKFAIYCDSDTTNKNYEEYIRNLRKIEGVDVVDSPHIGINSGGLQANYIKGMMEASTPFVFCCEHDWRFLREIQTKNIIQCMVENDSVNFIRFNKRDNSHAHKANPELGDEGGTFWETYVEEEVGLTGCDLMKTDSIATHPHIIKVSKFRNDWIDIAKNPIPGLVGAVEQNLYNRYTADIRHMGFDSAHKKWGVYNYGSKSDTKIVVHIDGSLSGRT
tara:strand:+ start:1423 stop:2202 length:780 start_codon:yes stop_codon:yes gene_type:complete